MKEFFYNIDTAALEIADSSAKRMIGATHFLGFGNDNKYPNRLNELFKTVSTLRTLVEGSSQLAAGLFHSDVVDVDYNELFHQLYLYGQCPVLVRKSLDGRHVFLNPLDMRYVRANEDGTEFAYSEQEGWRSKVVYPAYSAGVEGSSILMIKLNNMERPYALPIWSSSLKEVTILNKVAEYHNASLENGFAGSFLINFNNGMPSPEDKERIEQLVNKKFCGSTNAGKIMIAFNEDKEHAAELQSLSTEDTSTRYKDLVDSCKQSLFTSFRASSQLFGAPSGEESALSSTEYSYKLSMFIKFNLEPVVRVVAKELSRFGIVCDEPISIAKQIIYNSEAVNDK